MNIKRRSTSPIPIGRSPGFFSSGNSQKARKASRDVDWFSTLQIFLMTSASALHRSIELLPIFFHIKIRFQPSVSMPLSPEPPLFSIAAFSVFSTSIPLSLFNKLNWLWFIWQ